MVGALSHISDESLGKQTCAVYCRAGGVDSGPTLHFSKVFVRDLGNSELCMER